MLNSQDKWKLVSHLQKCIRRGWDDWIDDVVHALWIIDPAYLRYRSAIMALEDVGAANYQVVHQGLEHRLSKEWLQENGDAVFMSAWLQKLAKGNKDRTACTWGGIARWTEEHKKKYGKWDILPIGKAIDIAMDRTQSIDLRAACAFRVAGTKFFPHDRFPVIEGSWPAWLSAMTQNGVPIEIVNSMREAQHMHKEWHAVFQGLCWLEMENTTTTIVDNPSAKIRLPRLYAYCSPAIDSHTSEGKQAIELFWNHNPELQKEWADLGFTGDTTKAIQALSSMLFLIEGGLTNPTVTYPVSDTINEWRKQAWTQYYGMDGKSASTSVWKRIPMLHEMRAHILNVPVTQTTPDLNMLE